MDEFYYQDGSSSSYYDNQRTLHRVDGPAIVLDHVKSWYRNGLRHRLDGPAVEFFDGGRQWHRNGQLHRLGGPAIESPSGEKQWYKNGFLHRLDGPAIEYGAIRYWFINGQKFSKEEFEKIILVMQLSGLLND